jgi:hypothetical protein
MSDSLSSEIETTFSRLSVSDQLSLIERLVHHVHEVTLKRRIEFDEQLALMATDPEVQLELRRIEHEFAHTEVDGLETA